MTSPAFFDPASLTRAVERIREPAHVLRDGADGRIGVGFGESIGGYQHLATLPALYPEWLGDRSFLEVHGVRFPYVAGAMANGIASEELVVAMARAGMLSFFGAAGLGLPRIEAALDRIASALATTPEAPWGANLIHAPNEPELEAATADLFLRRGLRRVEASAYMALTPAIVRYAASGLSAGPDGQIHRANHVVAKISRPEVARRFMEPAPQKILDALVSQQLITPREAELARRVPVAEDITVEADSGGHTDNQPLGALFPRIAQLRDEIVAEQGYTRPIRIGAAGGLGTPTSVASAFALGAAYVLTGSVNQAAVESGLSQKGREMLAKTEFGDVIMAPAADMFELGVKLQVLKRGTMFGVRGLRLWQIYESYPSLDAIPDQTRAELESRVLGESIDAIWQTTRRFWTERDPAQIERAERDPKHKMALVFRWYLGMSSRWAITGEEGRAMDFQIWCGPAMAAFNAWVEGSFLEPPEQRGVVPIALNLLEGAAVVTRAHQLRTYGAPMPAAAFTFRPRRLRLP